MDRNRIRELRDLYRDTLLSDVLPFWMRHIRDDEYGGYRHHIDARLVERTLPIIDYSMELGWDREYGGLLYFVDSEGQHGEGQQVEGAIPSAAHPAERLAAARGNACLDVK